MPDVSLEFPTVLPVRGTCICGKSFSFMPWPLSRGARYTCACGQAWGTAEGTSPPWTEIIRLDEKLKNLKRPGRR